MQTITERGAVESKIREILVEASGNRELAELIKNDDLLFSGSIGLDSVDMVSVIILVERNFNINFLPDADLTIMFRTIDAIIDTVLRYKAN